MSSLTTSIVIYHTPLDMLAANLRSLEAAVVMAEDLSCQLYILDNSVDDQYSRVVQQFLQGLSFHKSLSYSYKICDSNLGYGRANNVPLSDLESEYHLVLNPDVFLSSDALLNACRYMNNNPEVVCISPRTVDSGSGNHVIKAYPALWTLLLRYLRVGGQCFKRRMAQYTRSDLLLHPSKDVELVGGCFLFMRTNAFLEVGGFDDSYFMYFEDFDISIRLRQLGSIAYVPDVQITHEGGDVGRKALHHHLYFCASAFKFFNRHGWKVL